MSRNSVRILSITAGLLVAAAIMVPATARAQVCGPLDNGHIADVSYEGTVAVWQPIIEYDRLVLTVTAPCEKIVREFKAGDPVMFDLRDVSREADGQYTWELRAVPVIDPKVRAALTASRGSGEEDALWWSLWQKGLIYGGPSVESGGFLVDRGEIVKPGVEEKSARVAAKDSGPGSATLAGAVATGASASGTATGGSDGNVLSTKDTVLTNADGVIRNSLCVGFDCPNSNTYSDTTVLLTENNTRIKFDDTSTVTGFPKEDWELQANSSLSGGGSFFAINDCGNSSGGGCADDPVFIVEGGAPANSIRVDNGGRVGLGTANPVVELHVVDGDTPTLRLAQDGSSGFAPQTWDVAGNETSFFVRDATNGSTLPFRILPGSPSGSMDIASCGNVGIGTGSPSSKLHIRGVDSGSGNALELNFENTGTGTTWFFQNDQDNTFKISKSESGGSEVTIDQRQDANGATLRVDGSVQATNVTFSSSRELQETIRSLDPRDVLARLSQLPITRSKIKEDPKGTPHIGPMAEDFHSAFPVGSSDKTISVTDASGITMAAIQGLVQRLDELEKQNAELAARLKAMEESKTLDD